MNNTDYKRYIAWGVTAFAVVALSILFFFILYRVSGVGDALRGLQRILMPFIYGAALAYIFNPIYAFCEKMLTRLFSLRIKKTRLAVFGARFFSIIITMSFTLVAIFGLIYLVLPQLAASVSGIIERIPSYLVEIRIWINSIMEENPDVGPLLMDAYHGLVDYAYNWLPAEIADIRPFLDVWAARAFAGVMSVFAVLFNLFIGLVVMIYLLLSKQTFAAQGKKMLYSIFGAARGNTAIEIIRYAHRVFGGFINGKLIESVLVAIVCFIFMIITDMPHVMLITVIIGVTNIIPFFGPFIGAIPSALLLLFESPAQCLYFLIFIFILQQVDCNLVAPRILRGTTGLPSFWVLFSILFFGGMFGFMGMVLGVPIFALIYSLAKHLISRGLKKHDLPTDTDSYVGLHHVEEGKIVKSN